MPAPADLKYLKSHEWHAVDGNTVTLGISRFAVDELTDVTFIALPKVGSSVAAGQSIGEVESVKATSDIYTGVSGKVLAVNDAVVKNPALLNSDPYGSAWLIKIEASNPAELATLIDGASYQKQYPSA
jgi:glycine cleavage system H protein